MKPASRADSPENIEIGWGDRRLVAELRRTRRRVLRIEVKPTGQVLVVVPEDADDAKIRTRVERKGSWIFKQIDLVAARPASTPERRYLSGETHLLLGRQYRLALEPSNDPQVFIDGERLKLLARRIDDRAHCRRILESFYTITARSVFDERLDAVVPPFLRRGLQRPPLVVRRMSKRWGSFTPKGRIVLNVELVRASPSLIDYVICHELVHAFYPDHGRAWRNLFDTVMPDWEKRKAQLETFLR